MACVGVNERTICGRRTNPLAGGEPRQLTEGGGDFTLMHALSADGRSAVFGRGKPRTDALMIQDFR